MYRLRDPLFWLYLFTATLIFGWLCLFGALLYLIVR